MPARLSNSPHPDEDGWLTARVPAPAEDAAPAFSVLAERHWPGIGFLVCCESIRQPTTWSIGQPRHTLIVHLGGAMRTLDTHIEGIGATREPPSPGDIWLVPAGSRYVGQARGQVIRYAELRIEPDAVAELPGERTGTLDALRPCMAHRDEFLYYTVAQMARLATAEDDLAAMMVERLQCGLRQHLFRDYRLDGQARIEPARRATLDARTAQRIADHIDDMLDRRITLAELAAIAQFSVHQLLIAFRAHFGTTPAQYVLAQRLRRARWLLLNTGREIGEIALATGFASHSHLSAAFKRQAGISPRQFREGLRTLPLARTGG